MKKLGMISILAIMSTVYSSVFAQDARNEMQSSKEGNSIINNGLDLSTGSISQTVPLTSVETKTGNSIAVNLVYTKAGGIRLSDLAERTGLGWELQTGGYITRQVRGIRDEKAPNSTIWSFDKYEQEGWLYVSGAVSSHYDSNDPDPSTQHWYFKSIYERADDMQDPEPDIFYYSIPGYSGKFYLDQNNNVYNVPANNLKIEVPLGNYGGSYNGFAAWVITTPDGTKYVFYDNDDYREQTQETYTGYNGINVQVNSQAYHSKWNLSTIVYANNEQIGFSYMTTPRIDIGSPYMYNKKITWHYDEISTENSWNTYSFTLDNKNPWHVKLKYDYVTKYIFNHKEVSTVTANFTKLNFIGNNVRADMPDNLNCSSFANGFKSLDRIEKRLIAGNDLLHAVEFEYAYFNNDPIPQDGNHCRANLYDYLKLNAIKFKDRTDNYTDKQISFEYDANHFSQINNGTQTDWWGFWNATGGGFTTLNGLLSGLPNDPIWADNGNRMPDLNSSKAMTLKKINESQGLSTEYEYEQNDCYINTGAYKKIGGLRIKKISKADVNSGISPFVTEYQYMNPLSLATTSGQVSPYFFRTNFDRIDPNLNNPNDGEQEYWMKYENSTKETAEDHVRYSHVIELSSTGKTVYEYSAFSDQPDIEPNKYNYEYNSPFTPPTFAMVTPSQLDPNGFPGAPPTSNAYKRGLLKSKKNFNLSNEILSEDFYEYNFSQPGFTPIEMWAMKVGSQYSSRFKFTLEYYKIKSEYISLAKLTSKSYQCINGQVIDPLKFIEIEKEFNYSSIYPYNQIETVTTQNISSAALSYVKEVERVKYPTDYFTVGNVPTWALNSTNPEVRGIAKMVEKRILNVPIEKAYFKNGIPTRVELNTFYEANAGTDVVVQYKTYTFKNTDASHIGATSFSSINNGTNNLDKYWLFEDADVTCTGYTDDGKLKTSVNKFNEGSTNIYAGSFIKPVMTIKNGVMNDEVIGNSYSYYDGESPQNAAGAFEQNNYWNLHLTTGQSQASIGYNSGQSYRMDGQGTHNVGIEKTFIPDNQNGVFKFTGWVKFGAQPSVASSLVITVTRVTPASWSEVITKSIVYTQNQNWQYEEVLVDLQKVRSANGIPFNEQLKVKCQIETNHPYNSSPIYVWFDDLVFSSVTARTEKNVYDPITQQLVKSYDAENVPTYYEYDSQSRLVCVKDEYQKVLKFVQYHFKDAAVTGDNHYVRELICKTPHTRAEVETYLNTLPLVYNADYSVSTKYLDAFGRTIQTVNFGESPAGGDMISINEYDNRGMQPKVYLPYVSANATGDFKSNALTDLFDFYRTNQPLIPYTDFPYTFTEDDNSNLGRIVSANAPGYDETDANRPRKNYSYAVSSQLEGLQEWRANAAIGSGAQVAGVFHKGELSNELTVDENGKGIAVYKDYSGKVMCKKTSAISVSPNAVPTVTHDYTNGVQQMNPPVGYGAADYITYYVYSDAGQLLYEMPPVAVKTLKSNNQTSFTETDPVFEKYIYAYRYDNKGRMTKKHVPGAGWTEYVYDKMGRIILEADAKLIEEEHDFVGGNPLDVKHAWLFTKYDGLGRVIMTGKCYAGVNHEGMQWLADNWTGRLYEARDNDPSSTWKYTKQGSFPALDENRTVTTSPTPYWERSDKVYTYTWYDDYEFPTWWTMNYNPYAGVNNTSTRTQDLQTGSAILVMDGGTNYNITKNFYDDEGRLIQQHSTNHVAGIDVNYTEYDWSGKVLKTEMRHYAHLNGVDINFRTRNRYEYDHAGRTTRIYQQTGDNLNYDPEIVLEDYAYNELGEVVNKEIGGNANNSFLQKIDYRHNIRGQLTSINNSSLMPDADKNDDADDVFGEEIYYDNVDVINADLANNSYKAIEQYNGNIAAIKWKTKATNVNGYKIAEHAYIYRYDDLNRMTGAYYTRNGGINDPVNFNYANGMYNEVVDYDMAGNIVQLVRNGKIQNTTAPLDNLSYTYNGFQLQSINEAVAATAINNDYESNAGGNTYLYEVNGNMNVDNNKGLNITYNYLNLPTVVSTPAGDVTYLYDATGNKLRKTSGSDVYDYVGGIEYKNGILQHAATAEGRVRPKSEGSLSTTMFVYDYFIKDHVNNVRAIVTDEQVQMDYMATMETTRQTIEEQLFDFVPETRQPRPGTQPVDPYYSSDDFVSMVGSTEPIGHAKLLELQEGDDLSVEVSYYFEAANNPINNTPVSGILLNMVNAFMPGYSAGTLSGEQMQVANSMFVQNGQLNSFLTNTITEAGLNNPDAPQAFLTWIMFDKDFNFIPEASGVLQAHIPDMLDELGMMHLLAPEDGYMYIYTNNHSEEEVNFNNLRIAHVPGRLIEANHYYPYGLLIETMSWHSRYYQDNLYKYGDKELQRETNLEDFGARQYDMVLGRWHVQDPDLQYSNPYIGMGNRPVMGTDPNGKTFMASIALGATYGMLGYVVNAAMNADNFNLADFGKATLMGAVSGAVGFGIGEAFGAVGSFGHEAGRALAHGVANGMIAGVTGGNALNAFAAGAVSSGVSSGFDKAKGVYQIAAGALAGGGIDVALGGDFWSGFTIGLITSSVNHAMHKGGDDPKKKGSTTDGGYSNTNDNVLLEDPIEAFWKGIGDYLNDLDMAIFGDPSKPYIGGSPDIPFGIGRGSQLIKLGKYFASDAQMGEKGVVIIKNLTSGEQLAQSYGGKAVEWVKKSSSSYIARDGLRFETHWYENITNGLRVEFKTKLFPSKILDR